MNQDDMKLPREVQVMVDEALKNGASGQSEQPEVPPFGLEITVSNFAVTMDVLATPAGPIFNMKIGSLDGRFLLNAPMTGDYLKGRLRGIQYLVDQVDEAIQQQPAVSADDQVTNHGGAADEGADESAD